MKLCRTCNFFSTPRKYPQFADRGECSNSKFRVGYDVPDLAPDEVQVEGDEGWGFFVGPEFGCIHHKDAK